MRQCGINESQETKMSNRRKKLLVLLLPHYILLFLYNKYLLNEIITTLKTGISSLERFSFFFIKLKR